MSLQARNIVVGYSNMDAMVKAFGIYVYIACPTTNITMYEVNQDLLGLLLSAHYVLNGASKTPVLGELLTANHVSVKVSI